MEKIKKVFFALIGGVCILLAGAHLFMGLMWVIIGITGGSFDIVGNEHISIQLNKQDANVLLRNIYNNLFAPDVSYLRLLKIWSMLGLILGAVLSVQILLSSNKKGSNNSVKNPTDQ